MGHFSAVLVVSAYLNKLPSRPRGLSTILLPVARTRERTPAAKQQSTCRDDDLVCADEDHEEPFELHVGRALDTLRSDYPRILTKSPNFSIYDPTIEFVDPSGVKVHGLRQYKGAFAALHALIQVIYCPARSSISYRL